MTHYTIPIYHVQLVRDGQCHSTDPPRFSTPAPAAKFLRAYLAGADREHFVALMLNRKNNLIGVNTVAVGSLSTAVVHPREVLKPAILSNASSLICGHNHPSSGDPTPSDDDREITNRLSRACAIMQITLLDHIIIGQDSYFSFTEDRCFALEE
jgi:DNA repair protein RadC